MKYALVNNTKTEAMKGAVGRCPICKEPVIAKCGEFRIHHWAHKSKAFCDSWKENETPWHREWKNFFPQNWQEYLFEDLKTGERHIADVFTVNNLVIEFQHSPISQEERRARETFYSSGGRQMIWVVDGTRLKKDEKKFDENIEKIRLSATQAVYTTTIEPEQFFNESWCNSSVPVFFDFFKNTTEKNEAIKKISLLCLLPKTGDGITRIIHVDKQKFLVVSKFYENFFHVIKNTLQTSIIHNLRNQHCLSQSYYRPYYRRRKKRL